MKKELEELKAKLDKLSVNKQEQPAPAPAIAEQPKRVVRASPSPPPVEEYTDEEIMDELEDGVTDEIEPPQQIRQQRVAQQPQRFNLANRSKLPAIQQRIQQMRQPIQQPRQPTEEELLEENQRKLLIEQERLQNNGAFRIEIVFQLHRLNENLSNIIGLLGGEVNE